MIPIKYPLAGCVAAAALGALAATGVAHAQSMGGQPMGGQSMGGRSTAGQPGGSGQSGQSAQLQKLHDALHLNAHQEQAWRAYQTGSQPSPDQVQQMQAMSQMSLAGMSTPQRLDLINQGLTLRVAAFHRTADATRAFYATLSPAQQHTFDQITAPPSRSSQSQR